MALTFRFIISDNEKSTWYERSKQKKTGAARKGVADIGIAFYNSIVGLSLSDGDVVRHHRGLSSEGRILMLGYSIFAFMFMSAYTASFTLGLVSKLERPTSAQSLKDIGKMGQKVCVLSSVAKTVLAKYTFLDEDSLLKYEDNTDTVDSLKAGLCAGGIMTDTAYRRFRARDLNLCKTTIKVDGVVQSVDVGMPVSIGFLPALNFAIGTADASLLSELEEEYTSELIGPELCPKSNAEDLKEGNDGNELGLTIEQMCLPIAATLICSTLAWMVRLSKRARLKYSRGFSIFKRTPKYASDDTDTTGTKVMEEMMELTVPDLYSIVQRDNQTDPAELNKAVDSLPDRTALMNLVQTVLQSNEHLARVKELNSLSVHELLHNTLNDPRLKEHAVAALGTESPKDALISLVLGSDCDGDWQYNTYLKNPRKSLILNKPNRRLTLQTLPDTYDDEDIQRKESSLMDSSEGMRNRRSFYEEEEQRSSILVGQF